MGEVTRDGDRVHWEVRPPRRRERALYGFVRLVILVFSKTFWRVEIHGTEHIPTDGPYVLAPVHRSNVDFALVSLLTRTRTRYLAKDSLWKAPQAFGLFISGLGAFPVRRGSADRAALRSCVQVIANGEPLVMFPEGTRQEGPMVEALFDGTAYVASRAGVPIVPIGIGGSERAMPRGAKYLRPVKVAVVVGSPLSPAAAEGGRVPRKAVRDLTERLRVVLQELFDDAQRRAGRPNPR